jgi:hypothetical protein
VVLANYDQGLLINVRPGGHFSPVAAEKDGMVRFFDVWHRLPTKDGAPSEYSVTYEKAFQAMVPSAGTVPRGFLVFNEYE